MLKSIHELVREYGYIYEGSCNCAGFETHKYKNANKMHLEWRKHAATFRLWNVDKLFTKRWENMIHLQAKLEDHKNTSLKIRSN